tara:strand:+ start:358 stop:735 length:378 start_codon:yes stop_codon:yes gene_type:complete
MKNKLIYIFLLAISSTIYSQDFNSKINQNPKFKKLLELSKKANNEYFKSNYFSIQIFSGNFKNTDSILKFVEREYINDSIFFFFETPNYKIQVGKFKSRIEAQKRLRDVSKVFKSAFILKPNAKI